MSVIIYGFKRPPRSPPSPVDVGVFVLPKLTEKQIVQIEHDVNAVIEAPTTDPLYTLVEVLGLLAKELTAIRMLMEQGVE